jgi:YD repeat-containing protein
MAARFESRDPGTYYFEYGPTGSYGSKTAEKAFSAGTGFQPAAPAPVEEALVGWTVHYRLVVKTNNIGTYVGTDQIGTTAWSSEISSAPAGAKSDKLYDVSCAAAASCVAVGYYLNSSNVVVPAAQRWSGSSWLVITPPAPAEGAISVLNGVSCPTTTSCMAVGTKQVGGLDQPLAMQWNGSAWSATPAPVGPGFTNYLNDVSCTAANNCEAVGYSAPSGWEIAKPLVMHWNGSAWAVKASANPNTPGGNPTEEDNKLQSVSCASASFCMAVGLHHANVGGVDTYQALIERLSGEEWVTQELKSWRNLSEIPNIRLNGVSCPSASSCMAVGSTASNANSLPQNGFTATWTGSQWNDTGTSLDTNGPTNLLGVSCTSAAACRAVGPGPRGLHWTGSQGWKIEGPKVPADTIGYEETLNAISCPTAAVCKAVGSYRNESIYLGRYIASWSGAGVAPKVGTTYTYDTIGETSATMIGWVNPEGVDTQYYRHGLGLLSRRRALDRPQSRDQIPLSDRRDQRLGHRKRAGRDL